MKAKTEEIKFDMEKKVSKKIKEAIEKRSYVSKFEIKSNFQEDS